MRPLRGAAALLLALPGAVALLAWLAWTPVLARADGIMLVRAGAFSMGRDDGEPDEAPLHRVFVRDFWIERHKVTNAEFAAFLDAHGAISAGGERRYDWDDADARIHRVRRRGALAAPAPDVRAEDSHAESSWSADPGFEDHPAVEVSWFGARDFCVARGRRLPSEAEWEKAARGDDTRSHPSGASYGVEGLLAHPGEWTSTTLQPYPYRPDDKRQPWRGTGRVVVRGASHDDGATMLALTRRRSYDRRGAAAGHHHVGFRCATSEDLGEMAPGRR